MNRRNIITIIISVAIFIFAAALIYRYFIPPPKDASIKVEVPRPVTTTFDQNKLDTLKSLRDFTPDITPNFPDKSRVF